MTALALERDALLPRRPRGFGRGLVLAVIAHLLLVAALSFSVNWHSSVPDAAEAELWAAVPQAAAPRAAEPPPQPVAPTPTPPPPRAERVVTPPPAEKPAVKELPDAQIALERERREQRKRDELKREEQERADQKREDQKRAKAQAEKDRVKQAAAEAAKDAAEKDRQAEKLAAQRQKQEAAKVAAQAERIEKQRQDNIKRMNGLIVSSANPNATGTGTAVQSAGPSASYIGRIRGRIRPNVIFPDSPEGNPAVEVDLRMAANGRIISSRIVKPSGSPEWDEAILRAVQKTEILPADENGRVPPALTLVYRLRD